MKSVFIIAIVAVTMIGMVVVPSAYSEVPPPFEKTIFSGCGSSYSFELDSQNSIFIPAGNSDLCKITSSGEITTLNFSDSLVFNSYQNLHIDNNDNIFFVSGTYSHYAIHKFAQSGLPLLNFDLINNLDQIFGSISDITTDNVGNIYVLGSVYNENDVYQDTIFKFNQAGIFLETLDLPPAESNSMKELASDSSGNIYYNLRTLDYQLQINKILPNGNIITVVEDQNLACLLDIEIDSTGNIYVATNPNCTDTSSAKYDPSGDLLFKFETNPKPQHQNLKQIEIGTDGKIYAFTEHTEVLLFRDKFVEDNVPPVITPIDDIIIETHSSTGSPATFSTTAIDAIDGSMDVTCSPESGTVFPLGTTIPVTCTSEDYSFNSSFVTFNVDIVSPPPPTISSTSPPTDSNTTVEGNNLDSKIFATGTVQNLIPGITTVSTTWKNPGGETVYQSNLQLDASGNFNNEFDNPMYVRDMKDSGLYTTIVTYDDVTTQHTWNYVSTVYAAQQAAAQAVIDAAAAEAAAQQAAAEAAAQQAAAEAAAQQAAQQAAADAAQAAINLASQPVVTNTITTVDESGFSQSCVDTGCYTPLNAVVSYGDTVTMTNTDPTGVHTFTSGTVNGFAPSPDGTFDTGVLMSGDSFQWQANVSGEVPYYCMLHTWMVGTIVVQGNGSEEAEAAAQQAAQQAAAQQAAADAAAQAAASQPVVTNTITTVDESGFSQDCMATGCYTPLNAVVSYGDTVTMTNTDPTGVHTFTSGTVNGFSPNPSQIFDSGVLMSGDSFQWQANVSGEVPYYCMLHTWMVGTIVVQGSAPTPVSLIDLDVSMSKTTYDLGELVGFSISGNDFSGTQNVSVDVTDPTGNTVVSRSINISPNTPGEIEFRLSEDFKTGTYKITATTSDNGTTISETSNFKLKSQFNSFTISDVIVSDQQGNSSTLQAGEMGFIKVNLSSTKSIATLVTVNLFDSELTSIGIGSVQTTLASGESEIILSFMIPDDAAIGPADIYVNAFSDWPSSGGTALTGELTSMEDIS